MLTDNLLRIRDVSAMGQMMHEFFLPMPEAEISVRQLIEVRVRAEVHDYMQGRKHSGYDLFDVDEVEKILNRHGVGQPPQLNVEKQVSRALSGFKANRFFVIVNDRQVTSLDQTVAISDASEVSFMQLVPLVGG